MFDRLANRVASRYIFAFKQKMFLNLVNLPGTFGIVSAYREAHKSENKDAKGKMIGELQRRGYREFHLLRGQWQGVAEQSFVIPNTQAKDLFEIGKKFDQDSVIYKAKSGIIGMYNNRNHTAIVAVNQDLSPAFQITEGKDLYSKVDRNWSFEFGFLWGNEIPWDGRSPVSLEQVKAALAKADHLQV